MFRRYATSKFRLILFLVLVGVIAIITSNAIAQSTPDAAAAPKKTESVFHLIAANIGFVSVIIVLLSVVGVTLIIQGFIQCRRAVFMPEETINTIRELIAQKRF